MPELPEVHTTMTGLNQVLPKLTITDIWTDMWSSSKLAKNTIKDHSYFDYFRKYALNAKIVGVNRRAKYILINLDNGFTIIIHMKMTGHLMYGEYALNKQSNGKEWSWLPINKNEALRAVVQNTFALATFPLQSGTALVANPPDGWRAYQAQVYVVEPTRLHVVTRGPRLSCKTGV
jgi:formamidopyrimidine-DNA glycosylase